MIARLLKRLTKRLPPPRIIWDSGATGPYMSRWHLWGTPKMPDGAVRAGDLKVGDIFYEQGCAQMEDNLKISRTCPGDTADYRFLLYAGLVADWIGPGTPVWRVKATFELEGVK